MAKLKTVNTNMAPELYAQLKAAAEARDRPIASLIRIIVTEWLEQQTRVS